MKFIKDLEVHQIHINGIVYEMVKLSQVENRLFTKRELEIAYCSGLLNQKDLTVDQLSEQTSNSKFPLILEFIKSLRNGKD